MSHRARQFRNGYTLVLTLLVLVLAAGAMTGVCRYGMRQTLAASRAEDELQRRWGELSCRNVILINAERILTQAEVTRHQPVATLTRQFTLGGQRFTIVLADEQAKVSVNALYAARNKGDLGKTDTSIRTLLIASGTNAQVALKPSPVPINADPTLIAPRAFGSLGQIVQNASPAELLPVSADLTCWGDGKLNFHRASSSALANLFAGILDADHIDRLRTFAAANPLAPVDDALKQLNLPDAQSAVLRQGLVDDSSCQSVWIIVGTTQRDWYYLTVADSGPHGGDAPIHFEW